MESSCHVWGILDSSYVEKQIPQYTTSSQRDGGANNPYECVHGVSTSKSLFVIDPHHLDPHTYIHICALCAFRTRVVEREREKRLYRKAHMKKLFCAVPVGVNRLTVSKASPTKKNVKFC